MLLLILSKKLPVSGENYTTDQARKLSGRGSTRPLPGSAMDTGTNLEGKRARYPPGPPIGPWRKPARLRLDL